MISAMDAEEVVIGTVEEEAKKRRERIRALQQLKEAKESDSSGITDDNKPLPVPKFRSYTPQDDNLLAERAETGKTVNVENLIQDHLEATKPTPIVQNIELENLVPKKIDWDLKRNIEKQLNKLERRTKKALAEIVREKIKAENTDLAIDD